MNQRMTSHKIAASEVKALLIRLATTVSSTNPQQQKLDRHLEAVGNFIG